MTMRKIGPWSVPAVGYGEWPLSDKCRPERADALAQLHRVFDAGVLFVDTADAVRPGPRSTIVVCARGGRARVVCARAAQVSKVARLRR